MWHFRFFGTVLTGLALLSFVESPTAVSAYSTTSESLMSQPQETRGLDGSFQLAVMGNGAVPLDMPTEKFPKKVKTEKPAVKKPKATPKKASKPKKKKVKTAQTKKAPVKKTQSKKPAAKKEDDFLTKTLKTLVGDEDSSKSLLETPDGKEPEKKEDGILTKTLKTLVGDDDNKKKSAPTKNKAQPQKIAKKKPEPVKKEEGILTKTFKSLVGGDEKKETKKEKTAKKKVLNPINMVPTGSASSKKEKKQSKTAISETKKTLKDSFEKLIAVGAVKSTPTDKTKSGGTKQAKAVKTAKKKAAPKPKRITARKYIEDEEKQLKKDRGGTAKGKNVLKDSFEKLIADDDKQKALAK